MQAEGPQKNLITGRPESIESWPHHKPRTSTTKAILMATHHLMAVKSDTPAYQPVPPANR